jgi:chorismate mutase
VSDELQDLRARIDAVDARILASVNERLGLVESLWQLKADRGIDRLDPGREQEIRDALHAVNSGPLGDEGVDELVDAILLLTKREQQRNED